MDEEASSFEKLRISIGHYILEEIGETSLYNVTFYDAFGREVACELDLQKGNAQKWIRDNEEWLEKDKKMKNIIKILKRVYGPNQVGKTAEKIYRALFGYK